MLIRFGYVAIALNIIDGSPNKTVTYTNLIKNSNHADRLQKLRKITKANLDCLLRVLKYNVLNQVHVFRITSKLIPLATHPVTADWDYITEFKAEFSAIGEYIRQNNLRVSAHPDQFTLINSPHSHVLAASIDTLSYHAKIFEAMQLDETAKLVLHIGGAYNDKTAALNRFIENYQHLPSTIKNRIVIENDDKIFTASDVLQLSEMLHAPMILDVHHHTCKNTGESIEDLWPRISKTWNSTVPKIHYSSPRDDKNIRAHADFIAPQEFYTFLQKIKNFNLDFDVMIEAKQKDKAMFQLVDNLKNRFKINMIDDTTIEL